MFCISLGKEKKFVLCGGWSIGSFDNLTKKKKNRLIPQKMHLYKQKIGTYQWLNGTLWSPCKELFWMIRLTANGNFRIWLDLRNNSQIVWLSATVELGFFYKGILFPVTRDWISGCMDIRPIKTWIWMQVVSLLTVNPQTDFWILLTICWFCCGMEVKSITILLE